MIRFKYENAAELALANSAGSQVVLKLRHMSGPWHSLCPFRYRQDMYTESLNCFGLTFSMFSYQLKEKDCRSEMNGTQYTFATLCNLLPPLFN